MAETADVFELDENFPTANALLVPGPSAQSFTVFVYSFLDWSKGNQDTVYSIAQSGVNTDGTWLGVFDPFTQTYSPITLPDFADDGSTVPPYTVVAISPSSTIVLNLQVIAPSPTPGAETVILPTITVTGSYNALITDCVIIVDSASPATITLPTTGLLKGQFFVVKTINTGTVTVIGETGQIDEHASIDFNDQFVSLNFNYDGTNFFVT